MDVHTDCPISVIQVILGGTTSTLTGIVEMKIPKGTQVDSKLAWIQSGDIIVKVNGESMEGMSADVVAAKCRREVGEKLDLDFVRTDDNGKTKQQHVSVTRATITQNPMEATTYVSEGGKKIGLLRVPSFSTDTVSQIVDGLRSVKMTKLMQ